MQKEYKPGGVREMMALALPMVISYGCDTVMMFCDRMLLSKLGPDMMNACVGGGISSFMMASFGFGLLGYSTALVAQYFGAGQKDKCRVVTTQAWVVALGLYPITLICRPLVHDLFRVLWVPASQMDAQIAYFDIMTYGTLFIFIRQSLSGFFSGIGRTRVVMAASITSMVVNVMASYILIYGKLGFPALGIHGAAYGTLIGSVCGIAVLAKAYWSASLRQEFPTTHVFVFDRMVFGKLLHFGSPSGVEMLLTLLAANAFVIAFHSMGPVVATASSILMNWDMTAYIPLMGMEVGVTSLVGRYMGAKQPDIAHRATMSGLKVGCVYAAVLLVLVLVFAAPMATVFRPDGDSAVFAEALPMTITMLRMISVYMFSIVLVIVFVGALRGAGDTLWAMSYHVSMHWLAAGVLYGSTRFLGWSAIQAWALVIVTFMLFSTVAYLRYRSGKWRLIHVVD